MILLRTFCPLKLLLTTLEVQTAQKFKQKQAIRNPNKTTTRLHFHHMMTSRKHKHRETNRTIKLQSQTYKRNRRWNTATVTPPRAPEVQTMAAEAAPSTKTVHVWSRKINERVTWRWPEKGRRRRRKAAMQSPVWEVRIVEGSDRRVRRWMRGSWNWKVETLPPKCARKPSNTWVLLVYYYILRN